jgi:hypothetical protein
MLNLVITSCTTAQLKASIAPTVISPPSPTATLQLTATPSPAPTPTSTSTPVPLPTGREIIFDESGSKKFTGTAYGAGGTVILLANMATGGVGQWDPFVAAVNVYDFTTITFNYRSSNNIEQDMQIVLGKLRESGYKRIVCIGASIGVTACSRLAQEPAMVGIVLIAGRMIRGSLSEVTYPKLFISGADDPSALYAQMSHEQSARPKKLVLFEGNRSHGTDLFASQDSEAFLSLLLEFVNSLSNVPTPYP